MKQQRYSYTPELNKEMIRIRDEIKAGLAANPEGIIEVKIPSVFVPDDDPEVILWELILDGFDDLRVYEPVEHIFNHDCTEVTIQSLRRR